MKKYLCLLISMFIVIGFIGCGAGGGSESLSSYMPDYPSETFYSALAMILGII